VPPVAEPEPGAAEQLIEWEEDQVKSLLGLQGRALHGAVGIADQDWVHTEADLASIAGPLTRICNRYEPVRQFAKHSDPLMLAMAIGAYGVRSVEERRAVLQLEAEESDVRPIAPLGPDQAVPQEPPVPPPSAPAPPRIAGNFPPPGAPPAPAAPPQQQPQQPPPPPPRAPAEAPVDPTQVEWEVPGS
jgi:hypothetical protein